MILTPLANGVEVAAPAKLNLFLEVLARRPDGFHEIETLMIAVRIFDTIQFRASRQDPIRVTCEPAAGHHARQRAVEGRQALMGMIPADQQNLAVRAVERLRQSAGVEQGAWIRLVKGIPAAAGLGGASSDAAAALVAANHVWKLDWSMDRLARLAAKIGSDIPFFLGPGAAICRGRGELIERIDVPASLVMVVVRPPAGLSTASVYQHCLPARQPASVQPLLAAIQGGRFDQISQLMRNRLEKAAAGLSPWIDRLRAAFSDLDCVGHQMSGSGTCYFGICRHLHHARRVAARLRGRGFGYVRVATTCARFGKTQVASS